MTLHDAILDLEIKAKVYNNGKKPTLKWLAETAMPKFHKDGPEPTPATYEKSCLDVDGGHMFCLQSASW